MSAPASEAAPLADLDRRVLGAGTTLRFVLLIVLITASSVQLILVGAPGARNPSDACVLAAGSDPGHRDIASALHLMESGTLRAYNDCMRRNAHVPWFWLAGGLGAILVLAAMTYWLSPRWKRRGGRLIPVLDAGLLAELDGLVCKAGLDGLVRKAGRAKAPRFVMDPVAASPSAVVFGHWRDPTVVLHAGLIARRQADPEGFSTVVLHELAHIRNGDVGIAYATEALWRVFAILILLPYTILCVYPWAGVHSPGAVANTWVTDWRIGLRGLFRPAVLTVLALLARADVLRTRELYADLDAFHWSGAGSLPGSTGARPSGRARTALRRFAALWRTHPAWTERAESLLDPAALFGVRATTMFLTAAAATTVVLALSMIEPDLPIPDSWGEQLTAWTVAALITGIAGVALWRSITHAVLTGRRIPTGLRAGGWLGLGLVAGELLSFARAGSAWLPPAPYVLLLLVAGSAALTWWVAQCAEVWILTCGARSLRAVHLIGLAAMLAVFGAWFEWWYTRGFLYLAGNPLLAVIGRLGAGEFTQGSAAQRDMLHDFLPAIGVVTGAMAATPLLVGGILLWLLPLAAWARRPIEFRPPWARRALPASDAPAAAWPVLPPLRTALAPGAGGGALAVCAVMAVRLWLHAHRGPGPASQLSTIISAIWFVLALCAATGVTAALTYWRAPRHPLPVALVAASTAMFVGLAGTFGLGATDGCVPQLAVLGRVCGWKADASWGFLRGLIAPSALGIGFYTAVLAAPLGLALRVATAKRRDPVQEPAAPLLTAQPVAEPVRSGWRMWATATGSGIGLGVVSVAVAMVWLAAVRPKSSTVPWLLRAYEWIGCAFAVGLVASVLVTVRMARRHGPSRLAIVALAAAAAVAASMTTAFALTAAGGCVPYVGVIPAACAWRPRPASLLVRTVAAPTALTLALCATAVVAICVVAWRTVHGRATTVEMRVRTWSARAYLLLACALTLVLVSGWWQLRAKTSGVSASLPAPASTSPTPMSSRRLRINAWLATGGDDMVRALSDQITTFGAAARAASQSGHVDPKAFGPLCHAWAAEGRKALAGPPVPDASLQALWHQTAQQAVLGGTECAKALETGDHAGFTAGVRQLTTLLITFSRFTTQLRQ